MSIFQTGWDLRFVITPNERWDANSHDFQWKYKYMSYTDSVSSQAGSSSNAASPSSSTARSSSATSSDGPTWWTGQGFAEKFRERKLPHGRLVESDTDSDGDVPAPEADNGDDDDNDDPDLEDDIDDDDEDAGEFEGDVDDDDDEAASELEDDTDDDDAAPEPLDASEYTFTVGEQPDKDVGDTLVGEYCFKI